MSHPEYDSQRRHDALDANPVRSTLPIWMLAAGLCATACANGMPKSAAGIAAADGAAIPTVVAGGGGAATPGDVVPESVIAPGVERLSYLSPELVGIRARYAQCLATERDSEGCAEEEWRYQDARLNTAYRALLSRATVPKNRRAPTIVSRASVVASQRAWLAFAKSNCEAKALRFGSSRAPAVLRQCEMEMTAYRAQELEDWVSSADRQLQVTD